MLSNNILPSPSNMSRTDDLIEDYIMAGYSPDEAAEKAMDYIGDHAFGLAPAVHDFFTGFGSYFDDYDMDEIPLESDRTFRVGCDFKGFVQIKEYEDANVFIPTSYYCMLKCYEKYFKLALNRDITFPTQGINPYGTTLVAVKTLLNEVLNECTCKIDIKQEHHPNCRRVSCKCKVRHSDVCKEKIDAIKRTLPRIVKYVVYNGKKCFRPINTHDKDTDYSILLVPFGRCEYHAVLSKVDYRLITKDDIKIEFERSLQLVCEFNKIKMPALKAFEECIYVYDIETHMVLVNDKKKLIPYALAYAKVNLVSQKIHKVVVIEHSEQIQNIYDEMFEQIAKFENGANGIDNIQLFAHNGGSFDNIYAKSALKAIFTDQILVGSKLKSLKLKHSGKTFILKDTLPFTLASLKNSCINFGAQQHKMDFDIVDKSYDWYKANRDWIPYLKQDVTSLASLSIELEKHMNGMGESITVNMGLPSAAWRIMAKNCYGLQDQYTPKHPSMIVLMKQAIYGGRVLHWKKKIDVDKGDEPYICIDACSLYPSAMYSSKFPMGEPVTIENWKGFPAAQHVHFIITVKMQPPNIRYPFHPYKTPNGTLLYRTDEFTGVYNDIDYYEMLKDGYKPVEFINGIYWRRSNFIFKELIEYIYEMRKKVGGDTPQGYFLKVLLASMYGKLLETIKSTSNFKNKIDITKQEIRFTLPNGQSENKIVLDHMTIRKPIHLASYVLAYSRRIMNEIIREVGPENIAYGDTDSLYISKSSYDKIEYGSGKNLGQYKNDYGEGKWITKATFLDLKRYHLKFSEGPDKCKFNGLSFRDKSSIANYKNIDDYDKAVDQIYSDLYQAYAAAENNDPLPIVVIAQQKFLRTKLEVNIMNRDLKYQVRPGIRGTWEGDQFYGLGYNKNLPEYKIKPLERIGTHLNGAKYESSKNYEQEIDKKFFNEGIISIKSVRLLNYSKTITTEKMECWRSNYIQFNDRNYFHIQSQVRDPETDEAIVKNSYYEVGIFGAGKPVPEELNQYIDANPQLIRQVLTIKEQYGPIIPIAEKDLNNYMNLIKKAINPKGPVQPKDDFKEKLKILIDSYNQTLKNIKHDVPSHPGATNCLDEKIVAIMKMINKKRSLSKGCAKGENKPELALTYVKDLEAFNKCPRCYYNDLQSKLI